MAEKMRALFRGDRNHFIDGVPARSLTDADWAALTDADRNNALASGLYEVRDDAEMSTSTAGRVRSAAPAAVIGEPVTNTPSESKE